MAFLFSQWSRDFWTENKTEQNLQFNHKSILENLALNEFLFVGTFVMHSEKHPIQNYPLSGRDCSSEAYYFLRNLILDYFQQ